MRKKIIYGFLICASALTFFAFMQKGKSRIHALGFIYNLTGDQASLDFPSFQGSMLAIHEQKQRQRRMFWNVVYRNGETDTSMVTIQARDMLDMQDVVALIGLSDDNMAYAAGEQAEMAEKVFITSGATSPMLPLQIPTYLFMVAFGDNAQAAAAAQYASKNLSLKKAYVLFDESMNYAYLLKRYFEESFADYGGKIVGTQSFQHDPSALTAVLKAIKKAAPDMIYLAAGPEEVLYIIEKIREAGLYQPIFGGDSYDTNLLPADKVDNVYFTTHVFLDASSSDPKIQEFIYAYQKAYHIDPQSSFAALGYDAVNLFFDAVKRAKSAEPSNLVKALGQTKGFKGVTGTITYVDGSHVPIKPVTVVRIKGGEKTKVGDFIPEKIPSPQG